MLGTQQDEESAQLMADGTRMEYNFIRPHMALKKLLLKLLH
jgi:hypothetical protein